MSVLTTCEACGHEMAVPERYAGRELFCTACKRPFRAPPPAPTPVAGPPAATPAACPSCGAPLPSGAAFCPACGATAQPADRQALLRRPAVVTVLAILNAAGALGSGSVCLVALIGGLKDDPILAAVMGAIFGLVAILQGSCAAGLWLLQPWGRGLQIGLSCVGLLAVPFGTLVSALILWYLFQSRTRLLFAGRKPEQLTPAEASLLATRSGNAAAVIAVVAAVVVFGTVMAGIVAAIAIPNLLNAVNRGRQKRSMADIRSLATAVEAYRFDNKHYPAGASSVEELRPYLVPTYLVEVPTADGWSRPLEVEVSADGTAYRIASLGRDGERDGRPGGASLDYNADIVWEDGQFVQYPEGRGN
jgi:general secretion pathway protein G